MATPSPFAGRCGPGRGCLSGKAEWKPIDRHGPSRKRTGCPCPLIWPRRNSTPPSGGAQTLRLACFHRSALGCALAASLRRFDLDAISGFAQVSALRGEIDGRSVPVTSVISGIERWGRIATALARHGACAEPAGPQRSRAAVRRAGCSCTTSGIGATTRSQRCRPASRRACSPVGGGASSTGSIG